jgi:PKD repeat protein
MYIRLKCYALNGLTVLLFFVFLCSVANADSAKIQNPSNGHWYQRFDSTMTWHNARSFCASNGAYLVTITSREEDNFVYQNLVSTSPHWCWLGGTDYGHEGVWIWVTGEPWNYTNWAQQGACNGGAQPDNCNGIEHFLMYFAGINYPYWNDLGEGNNGGCGGQGCVREPYAMSTICEWELENKPPVALFEYSPLQVIKGKDVTFNAASSYDSDGAIVKYEWNFGDGSVANGLEVTHTFSGVGTFDVTLTVTDNKDAINSIIKSVTVTDNNYYWRGVARPNIEKEYYDINNPPIFLLRDFEYKTHDYGNSNCGSPKRGNLPIIAFGSDAPEANGAVINTTLSVKIADVEIGPFESSSPYAETTSQIPNLSSSLDQLSNVMKKLDPNATLADGVATLTYSYGGNPPVTQDFNFKAKIPRFEGLYIFTQDGNGYWDWEPYQGGLASSNFVYLLIHGWQTTVYPNFIWMYDMALSMKTQFPDVPVLGWFWQKESYDPGLIFSPIGALAVSGHVKPQAELLKNTLISRHLNPSAQVHFIGHSFGGFLSLVTISKLLDSRQGSINVYDGANYKLTLGDTNQFFPFGFKNYMLHVLSNGVDVENYWSQFGGITTCDEFKKYNIDSTTIDHELCGNHGAPVWYYFDNELWDVSKNPWMKRVKFRYTLPWKISIHNLLHLLLGN